MIEHFLHRNRCSDGRDGGLYTPCYFPYGFHEILNEFIFQTHLQFHKDSMEWNTIKLLSKIVSTVRIEHLLDGTGLDEEGYSSDVDDDGLSKDDKNQNLIRCLRKMLNTWSFPDNNNF